jgi:acetyl-CoA carboxylase alpha subunit
MTLLEAPVIVLVHGLRAAASGALRLAVGDTSLMHEFAIYIVTHPKGPAILWRDAKQKVEAAEARTITAPDLLNWASSEEIKMEPVGGVHTNPAQAAKLLDVARRALSHRRLVARHPGRSRCATEIQEEGRRDRWRGGRASNRLSAL